MTAPAAATACTGSARTSEASSKLFADETTAPVLDPGRGTTKTGQLELALEDIEAADAEIESSVRSTSGGREKAKPSRQPLPDHRPRQEIVHQAACACPVCGGSDFIRNGEAVTEVLDYVPAQQRGKSNPADRAEPKECTFCRA